MFFIRTALILAHLIFWLSVLRIGMGLLIAIGTPDMANNASASRYLFNTANSGEVIDEGSFYLLIAVCLGIAAEIGRSVVNGFAIDPENYDTEDDRT